MSYNFRNIKVIPAASQMLNIVLSKTQRKTPTVVHPGYAISRIRSFYMRKIKFCEEVISQKLTSILQTFPKIEDIHPFYADLFNVLYDKDHYKLALGHVKATKNMMENMCKDYLKLVKYGDSLYRCKALKRAALGRMCTMVRKIDSSLKYLEQVRKHLARLPSINPYEKTIILTGYPNVGKSSFINMLTAANVQVQPYPFTTQSLYVGHFTHSASGQRFQLIDSPGILNHSLQEMNTIEMQSITALAHLKGCVAYFVDPSEMCGYSVEEQVRMYERVRVLFRKKEVIVVFSKMDLKKVQELDQQKGKVIREWLEKEGLKGVGVSTVNKVGVLECRDLLCERVFEKYRTSTQGDGSMVMNTTASDSGKLAQMMKLQDSKASYLSGMYVAQPKKRDNLIRLATSVDQSLKDAHSRPNIRKLQQENGGTGVFNIPLQQHYVIASQWRYDAVPQIFNGKNIGDFVDVDIWERLEEIEKEEELLFEMEGLKMEDEDGQQKLGEEEVQAFQEIKRRRHQFREEHAMKKSRTAYPRNKSLGDIKEVLQKKGIDTSVIEDRIKNTRSRSKSIVQIKNRKRVPKSDMQNEDSEQSSQNGQKVRDRIRSLSRSRSKGYQREFNAAEIRGKKETQKLSKKWRLQDKKGESDRFIGTKKPKHLFAGKSSNGKKDWR